MNVHVGDMHVVIVEHFGSSKKGCYFTQLCKIILLLLKAQDFIEQNVLCKVLRMKTVAFALRNPTSRINSVFPYFCRLGIVTTCAVHFHACQPVAEHARAVHSLDYCRLF